MRVLIIGDLVGKGARRAVCDLVPALRREFGCAFCIANAENIAGGAGLTANCIQELKKHGVDVVTSGDHVWDQRDFIHEIQSLPFVLRPENLGANQPGRGVLVCNIPIGGRICVINLLGRVFLNFLGDNPFVAADRVLEEVKGKTDCIFVDFHAEATSEKIAMGRYLEGRVTAVWGTHTHVPTADERILPGGTAYLTDVGMVGGRDSVLGREIKPVMQRFVSGMPARFKVVEDQILLQGAVIDFEPKTGRATAIERIERYWSRADRGRVGL